MPHVPLVSVIVPMYNEADGAALFFDRLTPILEAITPEWEIICIDDGSKDATFAVLTGYALRDARIRVLKFSRNFGKDIALCAGIDYAAGSAVIPIDADLQDPPELIAEMVAKWREGWKVVLATRKNRSTDAFLKRITAAAFYKVIGSLSTVPIPANTGDFRLLDRQVVEVMRRLPERTRFMKGLFAWVGFTPYTLYYDRTSRAKGETKWNYRRLLQFAFDGIFAFSTLPLRIWTYIGFTISSLAFLYAAFLIIRTLVHGKDVPGYASLMAVMLFIGGIQLISLGILGEYLGRIYNEAKQRPLYVVEEDSRKGKS